MNPDETRLQHYRHLEAYMVAHIRPHILGMADTEGGIPEHLQKVRIFLNYNAIC